MPFYYNLSTNSEHGDGSLHNEILHGHDHLFVDKKYFTYLMDAIVRFAKGTEYRMTSGHFLPGCA